MLLLGRSLLFNRSVYLLEATDIAAISIPRDAIRGCFACFIALDESVVPTDRIYAFAEKTLEAGAAYVCTWGADCERWHDIIDEAIIGAHPPESVIEGVITMLHEQESLTDALVYFFTCTVPDERFSNCGSAVILSTPKLGAGIRAFLAGGQS